MNADRGKVHGMDTKSSTYRIGNCGVLILMFVALLLLAPVILNSETGSMYTIVSAEPDGTESTTDSDQGMSDEQYEATKGLHETGVARTVNVFTWRLAVEGDKVGKPLALSYRELNNMDMVSKEVTLVCPGVFTDVAEWEGVPLIDILQLAQVEDDYKQLLIEGLDGYRSVLYREDMDNHLIFLALKVNGVTLPKEHGYPIRLVAEDIAGGKWVKWINSIEVK